MIDVCRITYDWDGSDADAPTSGCYLRPTGGRGPSHRAYRILNARRVNSLIHPSRFALTCERIRAEDIPEVAAVYSLHWYSRNRRRRP
jgi:hypothetical protein